MTTSRTRRRTSAATFPRKRPPLRRAVRTPPGPRPTHPTPRRLTLEGASTFFSSSFVSPDYRPPQAAELPQNPTDRPHVRRETSVRTGGNGTLECGRWAPPAVLHDRSSAPAQLPRHAAQVGRHRRGAAGAPAGAEPGRPVLRRRAGPRAARRRTAGPRRPAAARGPVRRGVDVSRTGGADRRRRQRIGPAGWTGRRTAAGGARGTRGSRDDLAPDLAATRETAGTAPGRVGDDTDGRSRGGGGGRARPTCSRTSDGRSPSSRDRAARTRARRARVVLSAGGRGGPVQSVRARALGTLARVEAPAARRGRVALRRRAGVGPRQRPYVRGVQLAALQLADDRASQAAYLAAVADMVRNQEPVEPAVRERRFRALRAPVDDAARLRGAGRRRCRRRRRSRSSARCSSTRDLDPVREPPRVRLPGAAAGGDRRRGGRPPSWRAVLAALPPEAAGPLADRARPPLRPPAGSVTLSDVAITFTSVTPHAESVRLRRGRARRGLRRPRGGARPADRRPGRRPEGVPDLAAPLRQVVARPPGARRAGTPRRAHGRGHRQQLQLLPGVPRGLRPRAGVARDEVGPGPELADRRHSDHAARAALRAERQRAGPRLGGVSARCAPIATSTASPTRSSRCRARWRRRASGRWSWRSTSSRPSRRSTAAASSTRCAPRRSTSARWATSSPAPSRA